MTENKCFMCYLFHHILHLHKIIISHNIQTNDFDEMLSEQNFILIPRKFFNMKSCGITYCRQNLCDMECNHDFDLATQFSHGTQTKQNVISDYAICHLCVEYLFMNHPTNPVVK